MASAPEFRLDKDDAKELGEAIAGVMKYHNVMMTPKQEAYALLIEAAAKVYPPMLLMYVLRKQAEAKAKPPLTTARKDAFQQSPPMPNAPPPQPRPPAPSAAKEAAPANVLPFDPFKISIPEG